MPFTRPTRGDLVARVESDLATRLSLGALIKRSVLKGWAAVVAGLSHHLHGHADYLSRQFLPDTADTLNLERWASILRLPRKAATFASGGLTFTGVDGSLIPAQTVVQRADGERYETQAAITVSGGSATVQIQAQAAGESGNADPGIFLTLTSPVAGVDTTATVDSGGLNEGADRESDDDFLGRVLARLQNPPQGGAVADYVIWSLQVAGITRAWTLPLHMGAPTVGVTFVLDGSASLIPSPSKVAELEAYLEPLRPVCAVLIVFAPGALELDLTVSVSPDNLDVRNAVEVSIADMLRRETSPGKVLPLSKISEAISAASGEQSHTLVSPAIDVAPAPGEIVTPGTITWV